MVHGRFALVVLAVLALGPTSALAQETIKIGFFAPLTGSRAADGASAKQSVELAVKEMNAAGGIKGKKMELIVYDDRLNPQEAVAIANKLIEKDQVVGVVSGSYSGPTRVTAPIFAKAGRPHGRRLCGPSGRHQGRQRPTSATASSGKSRAARRASTR